MNAGKRSLVPVITQDAVGKEVLMLAWADREALSRTITEGTAWYWSRSRGELWHKGETSGNIQNVRAAYADCDGDAVLLLVDSPGPACHTGKRSCFFRPLDLAAVSGLAWSPGDAQDDSQDDLDGQGGLGFLGELLRVIAARAASGGPESYVASLVHAADPSRTLQKVGEEAVEFVLAATGADRRRTVSEAADLLFHLLVALESRQINLAEVIAELEVRHRRGNR